MVSKTTASYSHLNFNCVFFFYLQYTYTYSIKICCKTVGYISKYYEKTWIGHIKRTKKGLNIMCCACE